MSPKRQISRRLIGRRRVARLGDPATAVQKDRLEQWDKPARTGPRQMVCVEVIRIAARRELTRPCPAEIRKRIKEPDPARIFFREAGKQAAMSLPQRILHRLMA